VLGSQIEEARVRRNAERLLGKFVVLQKHFG
jgi:hypothetical protein